MNIDWMIVDHYSIDIKWEKLVSHYKKLMVIDDLANEGITAIFFLTKPIKGKKKITIV